LISVPIRNADEFEGAFTAMMRRRPNALVTSAGERNPDLLCEGALKKLRGALFGD
jgi:hypothetical protein